MSDLILDTYQEQAFQDRQDWLLDHCVADSDVMEDEKGGYIIERIEQEDCSVIEKKVYLPRDLQLF
jgi:hypothetical protein